MPTSAVKRVQKVPRDEQPTSKQTSVTPRSVQEPVEQPYGVRDCAFRDPAGNLIRIQGQR